MLKKTFSVALLCMSAHITWAQPASVDSVASPHSFKSKHGHEVLPQCGEWALGISATGVLSYIGNLMNSSVSNGAPGVTSANAPTAFALGSLSGPAITGKYMKSATLAYRIRLQANVGRTTYRNVVPKAMVTPDPQNPQFVQDQLDVDQHVVLLGAGFEKRRGSGRLQGIYGAELLAGLAGSVRMYSYGNDFSIDFNAPAATSDFVNGGYSLLSSRPRESYSGNTWLAGARGFIGAEYFVAPKISLGGELGYSLGISSGSKGYYTTEYWNSINSGTSTISADLYNNGGLRSWGAGVDNVNAGINLHLYF